MSASDNPFAFINQYFDKIYIISLKGSTSRHQSIQQHLSGLNYEMFWGTDKRDTSIEVMQDRSKYDDTAHKMIKRTKRSMILAEYCCADSHKRVYQDMIINNCQNALIFEDDAVPVLGQLHRLADKLKTLPEDWDLILFDYYDDYKPTLINRIKVWLYSVLHRFKLGGWDKIPLALIKLRNMREYNQHFWRPGKLSGAHAYAVSNRAAKHYIDYQTPVKLQADRIFYFYHALTELNDFAVKQPVFVRGEVSKVSTINEPEVRGG